MYHEKYLSFISFKQA